MSECISQLLSRPAKVELLTLIGRSMLHDAVRSGANPEWRYLAALAEEQFGYFRYSPEPLKGVTEEAYRLARDNAELDKFEAELFQGGEELYIPGVVPSSELMQTIIQAFKLRSPARVHFRSLSLRLPNAHLRLPHGYLNLHGVWPDAGERLVRPCPFCVPVIEQNSANFPVPHVTDRYHIRNAGSGQQLTIELSQCCIRPDDAYGEPEERISHSIGLLRIFVDDDVRCQPVWPKKRLVLPRQEDLLLEVLGFASRDDLDAAQLTCKFWRDFVTDTAGTLALRPLQHVLICADYVTIQRAPPSETMPGALFDVMWRQIPNYRREEFRPEYVTIVMSLLRHGCALLYESDHLSMQFFCPISAHLADGGRTFRAKSVILRCFSQQEITTSLRLMAAIGVKDFDLRVFIEGAAPLIFTNDALLSAERFQLRIGVSAKVCGVLSASEGLMKTYDESSAITASELSDIREHCHQYLRNAVGCHVSFLQFDSYALFCCDYVIESFLAAAQSDDFTMPLSVRMEFVSTPPGIPELANCKRPALRDVAVPRKILRRYRRDEAMKFDVYHFQNYQTKEWLTVCLGKDREGAVGYIFMQKEKIMTSVASIDKMQLLG